MKKKPKLYIIRSRESDENGQFDFAYFPKPKEKHNCEDEEEYDPDWVYMMADPKDASVFNFGWAMVNLMHLPNPKDYVIDARSDWVDKFVEPKKKPFWAFKPSKEIVKQEEVLAVPEAFKPNPFKTKAVDPPKPVSPKSNNPFLKPKSKLPFKKKSI